MLCFSCCFFIYLFQHPETFSSRFGLPIPNFFFSIPLTISFTVAFSFFAFAIRTFLQAYGMRMPLQSFIRSLQILPSSRSPVLLLLPLMYILFPLCLLLFHIFQALNTVQSPRYLAFFRRSVLCIYLFLFCLHFQTLN